MVNSFWLPVFPGYFSWLKLLIALLSLKILYRLLLDKPLVTRP
jgi:hypothetical protein